MHDFLANGLCLFQEILDGRFAATSVRTQDDMAHTKPCAVELPLVLLEHTIERLAGDPRTYIGLDRELESHLLAKRLQ